MTVYEELQVRRDAEQSFVGRSLLVTGAPLFAAYIADIGLSRGGFRSPLGSGKRFLGLLGNPECHGGDEDCNKYQIPHGNPPTGKWFSFFITCLRLWQGEIPFKRPLPRPSVGFVTGSSPKMQAKTELCRSPGPFKAGHTESNARSCDSPEGFFLKRSPAQPSRTCCLSRTSPPFCRSGNTSSS
jgi:hypothetical protein